MSSVGEVILSSTQLRSAADSEAAKSARLASGFDHMDRVVGELRRRVLDLRTTPLQRVIDTLPRLAREVARSTGKRVEVDLSGAELELDRSILDRLGDPLAHLVRNAVDHGIEPPAERRAAAKPEVGRIGIDARRERDSIRIAVRDDGAGIDLDALRGRAVEAGLLVADLAEDLPLDHIAELVFHPGISTAQSVSHVSGRGVGMDAVRATVESLGGHVEIETRRGYGTAISLVVPVSAALQRVLLIGVGEEVLALPIGKVARLCEADRASFEQSGRETFAIVEDEPVPVLSLAERLGLPPGPPPKPPFDSVVPLVMVEIQGQRVALRADRFAGQQEIYVKPVPKLLERVQALAGLTVLGDGTPCFLLDLNHLA